MKHCKKFGKNIYKNIQEGVLIVITANYKNAI
jgi:hypothetical protein